MDHKRQENKNKYHAVAKKMKRKQKQNKKRTDKKTKFKLYNMYVTITNKRKKLNKRAFITGTVTRNVQQYLQYVPKILRHGVLYTSYIF